MGGELSEPRQIYERLWAESVPALETNDLEFDRHLRDKSQDLRRGLSLVFRPSRLVQDSIQPFLQKLTDAAPGQYFYRPEEFHVTVLAIIPGSESWQDRIQHLAVYQKIIGDVLQRRRKFPVAFQGVTMSRGAVMIQGFPADDTLAQVREGLRKNLRQNGLGGQLDVRYKINAAHVTVMRFCRADVDGKGLRELLELNRETGFGETQVAELELILADWYASAGTVRRLAQFQLSR